jgi:hypothetical protein
MEYASYLAGERWSDHPACTHPLLAELARQVNDHVSDDGRQELVELVPDVIGVTGADLHVDARIALRAAQTALPIAPEEWQRVLAVAVLTCEQLLAELDGRPTAPLRRESHEALALVPGAAAWAQRYGRDGVVSRRVFRRHTAPSIVDYAVCGIAQARVPDADRVLRELLAATIEDCRPGPHRDDQSETTWSPSATTAAGMLSGQITA